MAKAWSNIEVREIVNDYFQMLSFEINQVPYSKTKHRTALIPKLNGRSNGSVEFKHQNISAALVSLGQPYIIGYKPRFNYQKSLEIAILDYLENDKAIEKTFDTFAFDEELNNAGKIDFKNWTEEFPDFSDMNDSNNRAYEDPEIYKLRIAKINFIEKEQRNKVLGFNGEQLVLEYEKWRLGAIGKEKFIDKVEWISEEQGDGAGFDILSKNNNGTDRYIEVKTTKLGKLTPIYLSRNELKFSNINTENYYLYRVFEFNRNPKLFTRNGSLGEVCNLEPISYLGKFR